jgi:DNA polymerase
LDKSRLFSELVADVANCRGCGLCEGAKNRVNGEGDLDSHVVFVGEAPGRREDESGRPFIGSAGKLLDRLLASADLSRSRVFISNIVSCRPPRNRRPKRSEIEACSRHIERLLGIIRPRVVAPMGNSALEFLFERYDLGDVVIGDVHGKSFEVEAPWGRVVIFPLYHPAAAIYNRKLMWELEADMKALAALL